MVFLLTSIALFTTRIIVLTFHVLLQRVCVLIDLCNEDIFYLVSWQFGSRFNVCSLHNVSVENFAGRVVFKFVFVFERHYKGFSEASRRLIDWLIDLLMLKHNIEIYLYFSMIIWTFFLKKFFCFIKRPFNYAMSVLFVRCLQTRPNHISFLPESTTPCCFFLLAPILGRRLSNHKPHVERLLRRSVDHEHHSGS